MATTTTVSKPVKLQELLQQQQEPFILEAYLLERGQQRNGLISGSSCYCCCLGSGEKLLMWSVGSGLKRGRKGITNFPRIIRATYNRIISINEKLRIKSCKQRDEKCDVHKDFCKNQQATDFDEFSSASSTTLFNSCSESDAEETTSLQKDHMFKVKDSSQQSISNRKFKRREIEDRPFSPASVLEQILNHRLSLLHEGYKFTLNLLSEKHGIQTTFHQTKQLLIDCVWEIINNQIRKQKQQEHYKKYSGPQEQQKIINENTFCWKVSGDLFYLKKFLDLDFLHSAKEWSKYQRQNKDNATGIRDSISKEIKNATITDIIHLLS
ncbi:hypothetical protein K2173_028419 [Erythroxylum novogranatense]|uniref:Uncharacterized protein n=1 Tax=Erythroxylum novogranatense TaxID=1862640 RepID=A0AAV8U1R0_9ROSI|nr:hypothetical protein K2173_028419 [Erythroxylum novogranatense]